MVPAKYGLAAIGSHLVSLFEVRRPAIARFDEEARSLLQREAEEALEQMEKQCCELGIDVPRHWKRAREVVKSVLLPRYLALAKAENAAAANDYGPDRSRKWRLPFRGSVLGPRAGWVRSRGSAGSSSRARSCCSSATTRARPTSGPARRASSRASSARASSRPSMASACITSASARRCTASRPTSRSSS